MDSLYGLFEGFREYLNEFNINIDTSKIIVRYNPLPYDLIDKDLDFDETYYANLLASFDRILDHEVLDFFKNNIELEIVTIEKNKYITRHDIVMDKLIEYRRKSENEVIISVSEIKKL